MKMFIWSLRKQFKMQKLIQQLNHLTLQLQSDNHELIHLLQKYTPKHCFSYNSVDECLSESSSISKMEQTPSTGHKIAEATNFSRVSSMTVKQSSKRKPSKHSVKQSRVTQKLSCSKTRKQSSSLSKKRKNLVQEPILLRLKKISQKQLGKLSGSVLLKKKSKIYHYNTQY